MVEALGKSGDVKIKDRTIAMISSDNPYSRTGQVRQSGTCGEY